MNKQKPPRDRLAEAIRAVAGRGLGRSGTPSVSHPPPHDIPARLASLEREVQEVRTRVNALFFTVLTVAITDVLIRAVLT